MRVMLAAGTPIAMTAMTAMMAMIAMMLLVVVVVAVLPLASLYGRDSRTSTGSVPGRPRNTPRQGSNGLMTGHTTLMTRVTLLI